MPASTLKMNNRAYIVALLVCFLACLPCRIQAEEQDTWEAVSISMSNDGRHLAVKYGAHVEKEDRDESGYDSGVWIYNLNDLSSPPRHLRGAEFYGTLIAFSPDSRHISLAEHHRLQVFNIAENTLILDLPSIATEIASDFSTVSYSADGKFIMSLSDWWATDDHEMSIWDIGAGTRILAIPSARAAQSRLPLPRLSPDWRQFLNWWHPDGIQIHEFDIQQGLGSTLGSVSVDVRDERGVAFSPDSSLFALVIPDDEIKIFRTDTWELTYIQMLGVHSCGNADVTLAFGHINPWLIFKCDWYGRLLVWDIETGVLLLQSEEAGRFRFITLDDRVLVTQSGNLPGGSTIEVWDTKNDFEMSVYPGINPQIHPNSELMAAIGPDGRVWIWNIKSKQLLVTLPVPRH
ncbi:MAG: WD40 repeat domain-containing protein [Chloroflexi bacterium]|nr:WD40 repeat domain-containing protein [Chloroflexota bacterium]